MSTFVEVFQCTVGVEAQVELVAPAEFIACFAQGVVSYLRSRMTFCEVGSMGSNLIGDDSRTHVFAVRQSQMLFGSNVTEHGCSQPSYLGCTDGRSNVVVTRSYVCHQRAERIERCVMTVFYLALHVFLYLVQGHVSRTFDEGLHILFPCTYYEFAHCVEFGELGFVVGIGNTAGAQSVSQRDCHVVLGKDVADVVEVFVEERFAVVDKTPLAHDTTSAAYDTTQAFVGEMNVVATDSGMDGKVIHTLFALLNQRIFIDFPRQVFHFAVHFFKCLVDRYSSYRHGAVAYNPFARFVNVVAR